MLTMKSVEVTPVTGLFVDLQINLKQRPISFFVCRETAHISNKQKMKTKSNKMYTHKYSRMFTLNGAHALHILNTCCRIVGNIC